MVRLFDLTENLRLAEHHRIQPARHAKEVRHARGRVVMVELFALRVAIQSTGLAIQPEQVARAPDGFRAVVEHGVVLHAVAGREDERLAHAFQRAQAARSRRAVPGRRRRTAHALPRRRCGGSGRSKRCSCVRDEGGKVQAATNDSPLRVSSARANATTDSDATRRGGSFHAPQRACTRNA